MAFLLILEQLDTTVVRLKENPEEEVALPKSDAEAETDCASLQHLKSALSLMN